VPSMWHKVVGNAGQAGIIMLRAGDVHPVTHSQRRSAVRVVIAKGDGGRAVGDLGEAVGVVVSVGDLRLASDGHAGEAAGVVVGVTGDRAVLIDHGVRRPRES
jgi:hypothetical protein